RRGDRGTQRRGFLRGRGAVARGGAGGVVVNPSAAWAAGHPWSAVYDFFVERETLAGVAGRLAFGTDTRLLYDSIASLGELAPGSSVLDIPTGGGVALRGIRPGQAIRYLAADISPGTPERARRA